MFSVPALAPCGIYGGQSGTGLDISLSTSVSHASHPVKDLYMSCTQSGGRHLAGLSKSMKNMSGQFSSWLKLELFWIQSRSANHLTMTLGPYCKDCVVIMLIMNVISPHPHLYFWNL
jgi:hypothetical protein